MLDPFHVHIIPKLADNAVLHQHLRRLFWHLYLSGNPRAVHSRRQVHRVAPNVVQGFLAPYYPRRQLPVCDTLKMGII